jgi:hypothetical protein
MIRKGRKTERELAKERLSAAIASDTTDRLLCQHGTLHEAFFRWWKDDLERSKCTLDQAIGLYLQTFPGRVMPLIVSLMHPLNPDNQ